MYTIVAINCFILYFQSYTDAEDLHYAAFRENNVGRSIRQRDNTQTECVYSTVKQ